MARLFSLLLLVSLSMLPLAGRCDSESVGELSAHDQAEIRHVIEEQLAALRNNDAQRAFSYASIMVRMQFRNPQNFLRMVKEAYPAVYRARDVQFRELEATFDGPVQTVFMIGPDGVPVLGYYYMQQQADGNWKVNGCELAPAPDISI